MWGWGRGGEAAAGAALAALLLLALLLLLLLLGRRLRARAHKPAAHPPPAPHPLHVRVVPHRPARAAQLASTPPPPAGAPRREHERAQRGPPSPTAPPPPPLPRLSLPEQWLMHKRPPDCQYAAAIARPLVHMLVAEPAPEAPRQRLGLARSPSLEKDERSPFAPPTPTPTPTPATPDDVFRFEPAAAPESAGLRRYRSVSSVSYLNACGGGEAVSPRFFTPPENISPAFFAEPSPKSVYYDTVRSPRFFPDTPRSPGAAPPAPAAAPASPLERLRGTSRPPSASPPPAAAKQRSPKVHARNKENYFTFEPAAAVARPRRYGGRHSMDRERYTPPADREPRRYRRHNSADTGIAEHRHRPVLVETVPRASPRLDEKREPDEVEGARRPRPKAASLDSDGGPPTPPVPKQLKDQLNRAHRESARRASPPAAPRSPDPPKQSLRQAADAHAFVDAPRFSPRELEITVTSEEGATRRASADEPADAACERRARNPRNLTIDLSKRDADLERELRDFERLYSGSGGRPRTPTLKVKATSLDSSDSAQPAPRAPRCASTSVPNTPKRQPRRLLAAPRRQPPLPAAPLAPPYKQSLSASSTNLQTLPEGVPSDDFGAEDRLAPHAPPQPAPHASSCSLTEPPARNCLLQRRGSNHSLTLNIGGGGDLSRHPSHASLGPAPAAAPRRAGLLERRASNTSLTLSVGASQPTLVLSVSQHELAPAARRGILERRASNTSLTLSLAADAPAPEAAAQPRGAGYGPAALSATAPHRKALSSEDLATPHRPVGAFGSHGCLRDRDAELGRATASDEGRVVINTRPLSPQSTSEEFRQYLASMQHLQSASSVLSRRQLRDLHDLFQHGYADRRCGPAPTDTGERQRALMRTLHREFWDMPSNLQEKPLVAGSQNKNRYRSILPNEHSRVRLSDDTDDDDEGEEGGGRGGAGAAGEGDIYINANYIKGPEYTRTSYIATQGPLSNTTYEFWLMVQQQWRRWLTHGGAPTAAQRIVMLTELVEGGRTKCEPYFPLAEGERRQFASEADPGRCFTVRALEVTERGGYCVRRLELSHSRRRVIVPVLHYWFHQWADHRCPGDAAALLRLALELEPGMERAPPAVVHCSAGVGRTGCLLAILSGVRQLRRERRVDVLGIVCGLRLDRGGMLQTSEQYELVHRVLAGYERDHMPPETPPGV